MTEPLVKAIDDAPGGMWIETFRRLHFDTITRARRPVARPAPDLGPLVDGGCPACHHPDHDPGACEWCPRCELHTDDALGWLLRIAAEEVDAARPAPDTALREALEIIAAEPEAAPGAITVSARNIAQAALRYPSGSESLEHYDLICGCGHPHIVSVGDDGADAGCDRLGHGCGCRDWFAAPRAEPETGLREVHLVLRAGGDHDVMAVHDTLLGAQRDARDRYAKLNVLYVVESWHVQRAALEANHAAEPPDALREAAQALIDAISAAEATGWTWAGGAEWVSVDDPDYRLPSEMQAAQGALAAALAPKP